MFCEWCCLNRRWRDVVEDTKVFWGLEWLLALDSGVIVVLLLLFLVTKDAVDDDAWIALNRIYGLNFWLTNNSWHKHTPTTVIPCSLHNTAKQTYNMTSNNGRHLVWWGGRFRLDLANVNNANKYQTDDSSSALPTMPVTASVWT